MQVYDKNSPQPTKFKPNRNWNRRYQDGHHKPKGKK